MLSVRLDDAMQSKLDKLAKSTKRPKSFSVKEALANYFDDIIDFYEVQKRTNAKDRNLISLKELGNLMKKLLNYV